MLSISRHLCVTHGCGPLHRSPLNLMGAFALVVAGIWLPAVAYAGQLEATSNGDAQASSLQAEAATLQPAPAGKEPPSCTPEKSTSANPRPSSHSVLLSWNASTSSDVGGYNVYRRVEKPGRTPGKTPEEATKINQEPVPTTNCIDYYVRLGETYSYYVVTADRRGVPGRGHSNTAFATIPPR